MGRLAATCRAFILISTPKRRRRRTTMMQGARQQSSGFRQAGREEGVLVVGRTTGGAITSSSSSFPLPYRRFVPPLQGPVRAPRPPGRPLPPPLALPLLHCSCCCCCPCMHSLVMVSGLLIPSRRYQTFKQAHGRRDRACCHSSDRPCRSWTDY